MRNVCADFQLYRNKGQRALFRGKRRKHKRENTWSNIKTKTNLHVSMKLFIRMGDADCQEY